MEALRESIVKRYEELISRGKSMIDLNFGSLENTAELLKWQLSCLNILERTFGEESEHYDYFEAQYNYARNSASSGRGLALSLGIACMESAKEEIEKGFLYKVERLVSADLFDSILEHAEYLLSKGHKDPAAILGRVVIEKTLKQIAEREDIELPDKVKLAKINEILWKEQVYDKIVWRLVQGYIDLGNLAAHGHFDKYDDTKVNEMLDWIKKNLMNL